MAKTRTTRSASRSRASGAKSKGGGAAAWLLPAAALAAVGAVLLWPRISKAGQQPNVTPLVPPVGPPIGPEPRPTPQPVGDEPVAAPAVGTVGRAVVVTSQGNIRGAPTTRSRVVKAISPGEQLIILNQDAIRRMVTEDNKTWTFVQVTTPNGVRGWAAEERLGVDTTKPDRVVLEASGQWAQQFLPLRAQLPVQVSGFAPGFYDPRYVMAWRPY